MLIRNLILAFTTVIILASCRSNNIVGAWKFIEVYEGVEITNVDTLRSEVNISRRGKGVLTFNKNKSFTSEESKGYYSRNRDTLRMKYSELKDTSHLKISYIDKNFLLLSSVKKINHRLGSTEK
ncbi:hypothetical protein [Chryseobacterium sp.]|uniref:hypothetical protein n=1 Tax=Chryseobacterium sp. TaxID=1871047 RepID=UPI00289B6902|nr:hypothetical protein [Chryseobacterium sp.]